MGKASVTERILEHRDSLSPTEQRIADYILKHTYEVLDFTVKDLAAASEVSEATVIRMCQHIGFTGYWPLRVSLTAELAKYQVDKDRNAVSGSNQVINILDEYSQMLENLKQNINCEQIQTVVNLLNSCSTVHLIATGNTTPLIEHMAFRLGRLGVRSTFSGQDSYFMNQINLASEDDIVLAVSQSGSSKSVIDGATLARSKNLKVIVITAYSNSPLAALADRVVICKGDYSRFDFYVKYNHLAEMTTIELILDLLERNETVRKKVEEKDTLNLELISDLKV